MAKKVVEVRSIARRHSQAAITALACILRSRRPPAFARIAAANALLDRGWGKPKDASPVGDDPTVGAEPEREAGG